MTTDPLRLEVTEYTDLTRWRWVLTDSGGAFIADHEVRLNERDWEFEAAADLAGYISWHAPPDENYGREEARIVREVGAWLGERVLGADITQALVRRRPVTVQVIIRAAEALAFLPLEITHANGKPLAQHDISLIIQTGDDDAAAGPGRAEERERLRVLGLFSLPEGGTPLNLRRERHELVKLINGIAANGKSAEIRVLQYGVTRDRLRDVLEEAESWDIIHISGHGRPGELLLETAAGRPDLITAADLADLLDGAREHLRLVTLSACWSASLTAAEQRRLLHLAVPPVPARAAGSSGLGTLATELTERLGCAVLAMRYPVDDEFAIGLSGKLYELLAAKGQPLPRAVSMTLRGLTTNGGTNRRVFPALSAAAPAIFGERATELRLAAPPRSGPASYSTERLKMAGFLPQPDRFVGRTGVMARASEALAAQSGVPGVILHGMPGGGKTACALELAYTHEDSFQKLIWFKAPDENAAIDGSLTDFALTLERELPGLEMIDKVITDDALTAFLPKLTKLMERSQLLIVIDNAESLLRESGQWRDTQWGQVIEALASHSGLGRLILTTRRVSAETLPMRVEQVDALSADEALLLARELPHLDRLIRGDLPGVDRETARTLALGVLNVAQGHPKLLELADGQAAQPELLTALVGDGEQAWRDQSGLPDGFFGTGATRADPGDYLQVLAAWTSTVTGALSPGERDLFCFLCCLEESDRERPILHGNWDDLWRRLGRDVEPPALDQALAAVAARGLTSVRHETDDENESYAIHPGVAAAGRGQAGPGFRDAVDIETATFWHGVYRQASGEAGDGTVDTGLLVRAGLAAVPYLTRQQQWDTAAVLLHNAFIRDPTRANAAAVLSAIERITRRDPRQVSTLAQVLQIIDPAAAETHLLAFIDDAAARGDYRAASVATGQLVNLCQADGRLTEALALTSQKADYTQQAGLGPWTQLGDEVQRLQVLAAMGHAGQVLDDVQHLRDRMDTLPADSGTDEAAPSWHVRELLLDTGRQAALQLGRWQEALDLNAEQIASKRDRRAPAADIARTRFNDYGPLLRLGRTDEALSLLRGCRQAFQDAREYEMLGMVLSALADVEDERGHGDDAIRLERGALRYGYLAGDVTGIAVSHHNLGNYLARHANQPTAALTDHLTAALICALAGIGGTSTGPGSAASAVRSAAADLREFGTAAEPPADVADLCRKLGDIPGAEPAALIAKLASDQETAERTLQDLITQAQALARDAE